MGVSATHQLGVDRVEILCPADAAEREAADLDQAGALGLGSCGNEIGGEQDVALDRAA